jgi:hypothetical protein
MKSAKTFAVVACAGLLLGSIAGSVRDAHAQGPQDGSLSAGRGDSADASSSPEAKHPLNIAGCWQGTAKDKPDGEGTATFAFALSGKTLVETDSGFDFQWADGNFAHGNIAGSVDSTGFTFTGSAGTNCPINGNGTGTASAIKGKFTFGRKCGKFVQGGKFSITPIACQ